MKLDKAIETLTYPPAHTFDQLSPDYFDAVKLGIEALKRVKLQHELAGKVSFARLPGEDEGE